MDLREIYKLFRNQAYFVVALIFLGAIIGAQSAKFFPSGYSKSQLFFLTTTQTPNQAQNNYFVPYYAQENARNFTDTAVALLASQEFLKEAGPADASITIRKVAPQLIRITAQSPNPGDLDEPLKQISQVFNQKIAAISQDAYASQLKEVSSPTAPAFFALNARILAASGAILGLASSLLVIGLKVYLKL